MNMIKRVSIVFLFLSFYFLKIETESSNLSDTLPIRTGISIEADYIAYDAQKNIILTSGNINAVVNEEIKINCTNMQVNINERKLQAQGNITITNIKSLAKILLENNLITKKQYDISTEESSKTGEKIESILVKYNFIPQNTIDKILQEQMNITPLQGDNLFYDIQTSRGAIMKTAPKIEKIYFKGNDLNPLSSILEDKIDENYESDLEKSNLVLVCKKIVFIFGDKMEAHQVAIWSKGIKILTVPYYTTDFEIDLPDIPIRIRKIDYDSKKGIQFSSILNYSKNRKFIGKLIVDYSQKQEEIFSQKKEKNIWKANIEQQFTIGKQKSGSIFVTGLGERSYSAKINYSHYINSTLHIGNSISYTKLYPSPLLKSYTLSKNYNFSLGKRFQASNFLISYGITQEKNKTKSSVINIAWNRNHQFIEKTKLSYSTSLSWNYTDIQDNSTSRIDMQLDFIRSNIYIRPNLYLNLNTNLSQSLSDSVSNSSFRSNVMSNYKIKKVGLISAGYSVSSSKNEYTNYTYSSRARSLSLSMSLSRGNKLTARTSGSYDIKKNKWSDISQGMDVRLNKLLRTSISGNYDIYDNEFKSISASLFYNILGEKDPRTLQLYWSWRKPKETYYYITFNSMI